MILITSAFRGFGRYLGAGKSLVEFYIFRARGRGRHRRLLGGEILLLAEADRLRNAILSEGEVFGSESRE